MMKLLLLTALVVGCCFAEDMEKATMDEELGTNYVADGHSRKETVSEDGTITGEYSFTDETGRDIIVQYTAGKDGFRVTGGNSLPQPPALPQQQPQFGGPRPQGQFLQARPQIPQGQFPQQQRFGAQGAFPPQSGRPQFPQQQLQQFQAQQPQIPQANFRPQFAQPQPNFAQAQPQFAQTQPQSHFPQFTPQTNTAAQLPVPKVEIPALPAPQQAQPQFQQFQQPANRFQQFQQPAPQFQQPAPQFQQPAPQFQQPASQFQQPAPQFQGTPQFQQPAAQFQGRPFPQAQRFPSRPTTTNFSQTPGEGFTYTVNSQ